MVDEFTLLAALYGDLQMTGRSGPEELKRRDPGLKIDDQE